MMASACERSPSSESATVGCRGIAASAEGKRIDDTYLSMNALSRSLSQTSRLMRTLDVAQWSIGARSSAVHSVQRCCDAWLIEAACCGSVRWYRKLRDREEQLVDLLAEAPQQRLEG